MGLERGGEPAVISPEMCALTQAFSIGDLFTQNRDHGIYRQTVGKGRAAEMKVSYLCMMWHATQDINYSFHQVLLKRLVPKSRGKAHEAH